MRPSFALVALALAGCDAPPAPDRAAPVRAEIAPPAAGPLSVVATRRASDGERQLLAGPARPRGQERPVRAFAWARGGERTMLGEGFEAALVKGGVVWLASSDELLFVDDGGERRRLDVDVLGELAVSPSGGAVAYVKMSDVRSEVLLSRLDGAPPATLSKGVHRADRPVFAEDDRLLFVGAEPGGPGGFYEVTGEGAPVRLTQGKVALPARRAPYEVSAGGLLYADGRRLRRLDLATRDVADLGPEGGGRP